MDKPFVILLYGYRYTLSVYVITLGKYLTFLPSQFESIIELIKKPLLVLLKINRYKIKLFLTNLKEGKAIEKI